MYTPVTDFDVNEGDLNERIRGLFKLYAEKVLEGEVVKKLERKIENLAVEIGKFTSFFKRPKGVRVYSENKVKKEALRVEMEVVVKRAEEFRKGMRCLMDCIEGKEIGDLGVFRVYDEGNGRKMGIFYYWSRIHFLILRECRRVENGLPIYGFRSEFLKMLHSQQLMVLIGETGSGKSTQLAQFIADSGVASSGSILCTQPRKIAAISLGKRVGEECNGCYENNSIICYPSYSSSQQFGSKLMQANYPVISLVVEHFMCWGEAFLLKSNMLLLHLESPLIPCRAPIMQLHMFVMLLRWQWKFMQQRRMGQYLLF